ncbi:hypothetical protein BTO05_06325 [Winogradskyella sp. PC-19]|uniref:hypothetical protein n=1 Tax=unclassified Winogradskyella TaxID=2615021 RepID=UPI000B3C388F|nr:MULTISPECIES: hypothetical protein [unclassified Winogradskyella]ARV09270.1 hypothetical protein BTO05_06325 [Winogradskyella sp. PC-19]
MKKILKVIPLVCLALSLQNCEEELIVFGEDSFIQLENAAATSITENGGVDVGVTAILGSPQATDITVNFDVTGDASRYTLTPGPSVTIPAGQTSGTVTFSAVDDDDINGDVDVVFTLSSTSGLPVGIGGEGVNSVSKTITIVDDNVPCNDYTLTINTDTYGNETFWDILDSTGATVQTDGTGAGYPTDLPANSSIDYNFTLADGCYTLRVFDYWGDNGATYTLSCGALIAADDSDGLGGIPGLDVSTVPNPGFRNGGVGPDYVSSAEAVDFCVNQ